MSVRDTLTPRERELYDELVAKCLPKHPKPKPQPTVEGNVVTLPKPERKAERYQLLCEHNRALMRELHYEHGAAIEVECANQYRIDRAWAASRQTQAELDALYASTCVRGPGDSDWGRR